MGRRAIELLPPVLGKPEMGFLVTNDDDFIKELKKKSGQLFTLLQEHVDMISIKSPIPGVVN